MKNLYISLFFLMGIVSFGQSISGLDMKLSPNGVLENIFDQYGNKYALSDIKVGADTNVNNTMSRSTILCSSGIFDLYFETGSGMESTSDATQIQRREVVCQVFTDISNFIISPLQNPGNTTRVKIWVRNINKISGAPSNVLGLATAFYNFPQNNTANFGGITDNEVWKTIISGKDSYINVTSPLVSTNPALSSSGNFYHGMMAFKFSGITWNTNLTINSPAGQYDLYSVALHEITHALGFASLINENGQSVFGTGFNYFSRYDKFLKNNAGTQFLLTNGTACSSMYNYKFNTSLTTSILHPSTACATNQTNCATALKFVATSTVPVYTTNCFEQGSSLSHFEDLCVSPNINDAYFTMSNANGAGVTKRFLKFQERNTLGDIGYKLNTTYGNNTTAFGSYNNYGGVVTAGINVVGINDGINADGTFSFIVNTNTTITINSSTDATKRILLNDSNASSFECLQDVFSTATFSATSGIATTNVTFTSAVPGLHLLRYVPINSLSQRGNITYIYVYVRDNSNCATSSSSCEYVLNGDFEQKSNTPSTASLIHFACGWRQTNNASPDYFYTGTNSVGIPCNFAGYQTSNNNTGNGYAGMVNRIDYYESIKSKLQAPLLPNKKYQLSFDVSLAEGYSAFKDQLQAYLSVSELPQSANAGYIPVSNPNMLFSTVDFINNANEWHKIIFEFTTTTGGEQFLYLGGLNQLQIQPNSPSPLNIGNCNYDDGTSSGWSIYQSAYYYIDNVSLIEKESEILFNLQNNICLNDIISNLNSTIITPYQNGIFTGNGVQFNINNGVYSFNPSIAGEGLKNINYVYTNNVGCQITISANILVSQCSSSSCPGNLIFNTIEPAVSASYQASNTIITNTNYLVNAGSTIALVAGKSITFSPSSEVKANATSSFTASLVPCVQTSARIIEEEIVKEKIIEDTVTLFPNPTKEIITISTKTSDLKRITICSIEGKIVFIQNIEKNNLYQLNVANYQNGIYLAIIETNDGKTHIEKLIKN